LHCLCLVHCLHLSSLYSTTAPAPTTPPWVSAATTICGGHSTSDPPHPYCLPPPVPSLVCSQ
ncbi:hypothetical protein S83_051483, partial [Arachis hypogaea]